MSIKLKGPTKGPFFMLKNIVLLSTLISFNSLAFLPNSFNASFKQAIESKKSKKKKRFINGIIDYKFPGHIKFEITAPDKSTYMSNNKKTWYYRAPIIEGEFGEVTIQDAKTNPLHTLFDVLKNGLKTNKSYSVEIKDKTAFLAFEKEFSKKLGIVKAEIAFSSSMDFKNIDKITLHYERGKSVDLFLSDIKENVTYDQKFFEFVTPQKTKVIN